MIRILGLVVVAFLVLLAADWLLTPAPSHAPRIATRRITVPRSAAPAFRLAAPAPSVAQCQDAPAFAAAAQQNAGSISTAAWSALGRPEQGWEIYAPHIEHELAVACPPTSSGFAEALANWQRAHQLPATGAMDEATLKAFDLVWLRRRPFVAATAGGACPPPPALDRLAAALPEEGYEGEPVELRAGALAAYRRLVAAARAEAPAIFGDRRLLTIFSGYRDPAGDAARCAAGGNCGTIARANCSAHRTGLAMDLYLGHAPGYPPESAADPNRLYQSQTPAYRWLVANAARFGFVNYAFEPWHWEWTGEAP